MSLASCFAAGVFLGTSFLHLLPEARDRFSYVFCRRGIESDYAVTEFTVICGFFLVLVFEQLVLIFHKPRKPSQCDTANVPPHGCDPPRACSNCDNHNDQSKPSYRERHSASDSAESETSLGPVVSPDSSSPVRSDGNFVVNANGRVGGSHVVVVSEPVGVSDGVSLVSEAITEGSGVDIEVDLVTRDTSRTASLRALLLLAALSLHSLFEGLALGLQSNASDVFGVFVAILLHKCVLAFSLGVRLVKVKSSLKIIFRGVFLLAIMSPVGVTVGIFVSSSNADALGRETVTAVLQGIATGTFLFVTFIEILANELKNRSEIDVQMLKVVLTVVGYAVVAGVSLRAEEGHSSDFVPCSKLVEFKP